MVEVIGAMTTIVRYIFKSEGVTTTHGRVFAISPPRVGSNSTQYVCGRRAYEAGLGAISDCAEASSPLTAFLDK